MSFQKTVLIIALIIFSIMLFFIALAMKGLKTKQEYPPEIAECPDYWGKDATGKCVPNVYNKSTESSCGSYNGNDEKKSWQMSCGVEWDGISNI